MKIKLAKIKDFLGEIPTILVKKPFFTTMSFLLITFVLGGIIFYKYCFLVEKAEPQVIEKPLSLKEDLFKKILEEWEERERKLEQIKYKGYPNPFQRPFPEELTD